MDEIRRKQRVTPDVETGVHRSQVRELWRENRRLRNENTRMKGRLRRFAWVFLIFSLGFFWVQGLMDFEYFHQADIACAVLAICCCVAAWIADGDQTREDTEDD